MKKELLSLLLILMAASASAREKTDTTYWTRKGVAGLNLSQVSLTNWSAGGDGSVAFDALFNYSLDYKKERHLWQNRLELAYGMSHTSSDGARKTNDKIYLSSTYGYEIAKTGTSAHCSTSTRSSPTATITAKATGTSFRASWLRAT